MHLLFLLFQILRQQLPHLFPFLLKRVIQVLLPRAHPSLKNGGSAAIANSLLEMTIALAFAKDTTILWPLGRLMLSDTVKNF